MPILKEFELDTLYIADKVTITRLMRENSWEYVQATRHDYELNWKSKHIDFRLQTRCITSFFERCFESFKTDCCWKIAVICVPDITSKPRIIGGIYEVQVVYSIDRFFGLSDEDKKKVTLELLYQGINEVLCTENWDKCRFTHAYEQIIESGYLNSWTWKQQKKSLDRKYIAKVVCEHGIYSCDISIIIQDKNGNNIGVEKVVSTKPDEWAYSRYLGELKWISNKDVILYSVDKETSFTISID